MINQRDIVEVPFNLPQGIINHPVIVLSTNEAIEDEEAFVGLMITSQNKEDFYTFEITPEMVTKKLPSEYNQARLHLISFFRTKEIIKNSNLNTQLKIDYFKELIKQVNKVTFGI